MAHTARLRAAPTVALRSATVRGERLPRISIRQAQARHNATSAAIRETNVDCPGQVPPVSVPQRSSALEQRIAAVKKAKPFSDFLTDTFNRQHDYLRISITERCNLRCLYCMPEEGIPLSPAEHMLTTPEIFYLSSLFVSQGVTKIRLTGGEPTVRRDIVPMMQQIGTLRRNGLRELALTTNGIALHRKLDDMVEAGLTGINLSLDTLDPFQFQIMTRRNGFDAVMKSINRILEMNKLGAGVKLKVNCVVMRGLNEREIIPFVEMGREKDIEVRFIEYMPFGGNKWSQGKMISFQEMLDIIRAKYPDLRRLPGHKNDTSKTFEVPGFVGKVGFITSMTNDFCGTCNRLRITSDGNLKVCLHGNAEVSLRDVLRQGNNGQPIDQEAFERIKQLEMDRHEGRLSDETILGWGQRERQLLDVIGAAVKRKAEKHADMGDLENMTNRPMILIDNIQPQYRRPVRSQYLQSPIRTPSDSLLSHSFLFPTTHMSQISIRPFSTSLSNDIRIRATEDTSTPRKADELPYPTSNRVRRREKEYEQVRENYGVDIRLLTPEKIEAVRTKYKLTSPAFASYWNHVNNNRHKKSNRDFERLKRNWKRSKPDAIIHNLTHWAMMREVQDIVPESEKVPVVTERNIEPDNEMEGEDSDSADLDHILDRAVSRVEVKKPDPAWDWNRNTFTTANPERSQNDNTEPPPLRGRRRNGNLRLHWVGSRTRNSLEPKEPKEPSLPHLTSTGSAHMVSVSEKRHTTRTAIAVGTVFFSTDLPLRLITNWALKKGDVLSVSRIAGIMAVKKCSDIIPLCHPIPITHVSVELKTFPPDTSNEIMRYGGVMIESKVECTGPTGVEMEALTGVMAAALSVVDMCKAADKAQRIGEVRVVKKVGGRSGVFVEKGWESWQDGKVRDLLGRVVEPPE